MIDEGISGDSEPNTASISFSPPVPFHTSTTPKLLLLPPSPLTPPLPSGSRCGGQAAPSPLPHTPPLPPSLPQVQDVEGKLPPKVAVIVKVPMCAYQVGVGGRG